MVLNSIELASLIEKVVSRITKEIEIANRNNDINSYLSSIRCEDLIERYNTYYDSRNAKILVVAGTEVNADDLRMAAKKNGINPNLLELRLDYNKNKHYDFSKLKNNSQYSDIIFGPVSHKVTGLGDYSNIIEMFNQNPEEYPKVIKASTGNDLKLTKTSFTDALKKTQRYQELYSY